MTDAAGRHREEDDQHIPGDTDLRALAKVLITADGHEADDDMGHAEVTKTPAKAGSHSFPVREHVPVIRIGLTQGFDGHMTLSAADEPQGEDRSNEEGAKLQQALEEVCPADGAEAAHKRVANNNGSGNIHEDLLVQQVIARNKDIAADGLEKRTAGFDAGSGVDGVGDQEDNGTEDLKSLAGGFEPVGQILGKGN